MPRDRDSSFDPKIVAKRQRRLAGLDDVVISLSAKGSRTGGICAHLAEVYGARYRTCLLARKKASSTSATSSWWGRESWATRRTMSRCRRKNSGRPVVALCVASFNVEWRWNGLERLQDRCDSTVLAR